VFFKRIRKVHFNPEKDTLTVLVEGGFSGGVVYETKIENFCGSLKDLGMVYVDKTVPDHLALYLNNYISEVVEYGEA